MDTVDRLELALFAAERLGYTIRHEWLGGQSGGGCEIGGKKYIFVDLAISTGEQLDQVIEAIQRDPGIFSARFPDELRRLLGVRRVA